MTSPELHEAYKNTGVTGKEYRNWLLYYSLPLLVPHLPLLVPHLPPLYLHHYALLVTAYPVTT